LIRPRRKADDGGRVEVGAVVVVDGDATVDDEADDDNGEDPVECDADVDDKAAEGAYHCAVGGGEEQVALVPSADVIVVGKNGGRVDCERERGTPKEALNGDDCIVVTGGDKTCGEEKPSLLPAGLEVVCKASLFDDEEEEDLVSEVVERKGLDVEDGGSDLGIGAALVGLVISVSDR